MARKRRGNQKKRVEFRQNRAAPARAGDWTREFARAADDVADSRRGESVRPKGELSRKRTIIVDEDHAPVFDPVSQRCGTVTAVYGLICRVVDDESRNWDCTVRRVLRTVLIDQRSGVTVGDRVWFVPAAQPGEAAGSGVIEQVEPRRTLLSRRVRTGHDARAGRGGREHPIVANADQLLIVASVARPALKPHLVDRYLVAALQGGLRPLICLNKADLLERADDPASDFSDETGMEEPREVQAVYAALGYFCVFVSALQGIGVKQLADELAGHITVVAGQSGVGKSSLLNAIQPGLRLTVGEVSAENDKGRHTTSLAQSYRLDVGGFVVDTPGVRQFDMWDVAPGALEAYFVEFLPYVARCRFNDCSHRREDGCAVLAAVDSGAISWRRHQSYVKLFAEV